MRQTKIDDATLSRFAVKAMSLHSDKRATNQVAKFLIPRVTTPHSSVLLALDPLSVHPWVFHLERRIWRPANLSSMSSIRMPSILKASWLRTELQTLILPH
jgi:hypothetical protein